MMLPKICQKCNTSHAVSSAELFYCIYCRVQPDAEEHIGSGELYTGRAQKENNDKD